MHVNPPLSRVCASGVAEASSMGPIASTLGQFSPCWTLLSLTWVP